MKNRLLFPIIFAFIFSACSDFSGNEDEVEASLKPGPVAKQKKDAEEESESKREYYNLNGITYGNNTFAAVGERGTVRTSSDNGATWDNGTRGTTSELYEIAYGDSTFVTVGYRGANLYSSDNGLSWDNGTWDENEDLTGVANGNNTFVALGTRFIKSTDNGTNWITKHTANLYDVAFGNSTFVGCGSGGTIYWSTDNGTNWGTRTSGTAWDLKHVGFGNNTFVVVGLSGTMRRSTDNGSTWGDVTSGTTNNLYSISYGNSKFVAVGANIVVVSTNSGSTFSLKEDEYTFNDITFGNGVFVAVGDDEKIYTSTDDGDTWTKVYGK